MPNNDLKSWLLPIFPSLFAHWKIESAQYRKCLAINTIEEVSFALFALFVFSCV
jgi:hypothetical protein